MPARQPAEQRVLPMQLKIGDRRPYMTATGKNAHVRVKRVDQAEVTMIRSWDAHDRINVKRA